MRDVRSSVRMRCIPSAPPFAISNSICAARCQSAMPSGLGFWRLDHGLGSRPLGCLCSGIERSAPSQIASQPEQRSTLLAHSSRTEGLLLGDAIRSAAERLCYQRGAFHPEARLGLTPAPRRRQFYPSARCGTGDGPTSSTATAAACRPRAMRCKLPGSLSVEIATHAIEQRRLFFVLADIDDAPEEDAVGCLVDGIGQLAFEADRGVGEDRDSG